MGSATMGNKRLDFRRLKLHRSYTVADAAKALGCTRATIRSWLKSGLRAVDGQRPVIINGRDLRDFMEDRRAGKKKKLRAGEFYCFGCRTQREPALGEADLVPNGPVLGVLVGICGVCGSIMNRRVSVHRWRAAAGEIQVQLKQCQSRLDDTDAPNVNLYFEDWLKT